MTYLGAEFRRNLWLEFSPQRLIALPVIVLVLVLGNQVVNKGDGADLAQLGSWIFYLMVFLWGSRRAASAVAEEVNGGTWTGQRLSALSPAALVLGKLFGATAYVWFGGLIGLGLQAFGWLSLGLPPGPLLLDLAQRLASGVFLHAVAIALTLVLLNKRRLVGRLGTTLPQVLALLAGLALVGLFTRYALFASSLLSVEVLWYGARWDTPGFLAVSSLAFALWALLACLRLMATQLQRQLLPWAWPAFTLFCVLYVAGLGGESGLEAWFAGPFAAPFGVALGCFYLALFADRNEPLRYRQLGAAWAAGERRRALALLPWWLVGWPVLLGVVLWQAGGTPAELGIWGDLAEDLAVARPEPLAASLAVAAFALRDAAFVLFINAGRVQRGDLTALIYLLVLYGPGMALLGGMSAWTAIGLLAPVPLGDSWVGLLSALTQAALLGFLTWRRWRALFGG